MARPKGSKNKVKKNTKQKMTRSKKSNPKGFIVAIRIPSAWDVQMIEFKSLEKAEDFAAEMRSEGIDVLVGSPMR